MKILVVDDDPHILDALTVGLQLQWQDADVLAATDGEAGAASLLRARPRRGGARRDHAPQERLRGAAGDPPRVRRRR